MKGYVTVFTPQTFVILNLNIMYFICEIFIYFYRDVSQDTPSHSNFNIINPNQSPCPLMPKCFFQPKTFITRVYANQTN